MGILMIGEPRHRLGPPVSSRIMASPTKVTTAGYARGGPISSATGDRGSGQVRAAEHPLRHRDVVAVPVDRPIDDG